MARLEKQFDKNKWAEMLKIKQAEDKAVKEALRANKAAGLMIAEGKGGSPGKDTSDWDKNWPKPGSAPKPEDRPNIPTKLADLGPGDMRGPTEKGFYLTDEDGIHGHVYQNEGGYLKEGNMYDSGIHGLPVPRVDLQIRPNEEVLLANAADLPMGDGMIKEALTQMQNSNKQKYDLMYQEGFINRQQYEKQMKRTFGKKYQQYLVD